MLKSWRKTVGGSDPWWAQVGNIVYIQDNVRPFSGPSNIVRKAPWIIEAWHTRETFTGGCAGVRAETRYMRGGHLASVRCLRTGRRTQVADWILQRCAEL